MRKNVLVFYTRRWSFCNAVRAGVQAFGDHSSHRIWYCDVSSGVRAPDLEPFDCLIFNYCFWGYCRTVPPVFRQKVASFPGLKIAIFQDEYDYFLHHEKTLIAMNVDIIVTLVEEVYWRDVFRDDAFRRVTFINALSGYVSDSLLSFSTPKPVTDREWTLGYRTRPVPYHYGRLTHEKWLLGQRMKQICAERGIPANIETTEASCIYGPAWPEFLGNCCAVLGSESGSNVFDFDGSIKPAIEAFLKEHPDADFEMVHAYFLQENDGTIHMNQVSPRIFEAIVMRTGLVLFEGNYSGVVRPWVHYIPLKKDFSNVEEVFSALEDRVSLEAMTARAYRDVITSGKYHFRTYIHTLDEHISNAPRRGKGYEPCYGLIGWRDAADAKLKPMAGQSMQIPTRRPLRHFDQPAPQQAMRNRLSWLHPADPIKSVTHRSWQTAHCLSEVDLAMLTERIDKGQARPQFTFVIKASHAALAALGTTLQSLQQQHYPTWQLIVLADFAQPDSVLRDAHRIRWLEATPLQGVECTHTLNAVLTDSPNDWIALIPAGVTLTPDCLLRLADTVQSLVHCQALYTDHDTLPLTGKDAEAQFKPDFNLAYLLSWDYIGAACWFRQQALRQLNGFAALTRKQSYEFILRIVEHYGEAAVSHLAYPLLHLPQERESDLFALAEQQQAIEGYLARVKRQGEVCLGTQPGLFQLSYPLITQALVSIIIPNRNQRALLEPCIQSLLDNTAYEHFEILIIDNQSDDSDVLDYYRQIQAQHPERIRVLDHDAPFNLSDKYNFGASQAHGEYLLLLHNDIEAIAPDWLERMLMHAQHPEIGAVGAKLIYPETGRIQHGGIVLGGGSKLLDLAAHYGTECKLNDAGYMNRLQCDLYLSAVSGACMLVRREVYNRLGGFNSELSGACNDIEFCLRLGQAGYKLLWTPYAVLIHHYGIDGSGSKAQDYNSVKQTIAKVHEREFLLARWMPQLANDPAYNHNLTLRGLPLSLDETLPLGWAPNVGERPKIFAATTVGHCVTQSLSALSDAGLAQTYCLPLNARQMPKPLEIARFVPDVIVVQDGLNERYVESLRYYKKYFAKLLRIVTLDALPINVSLNDCFSSTRQESLSLIDRVIVATEPLAAWVGQWIDDIHLVPTRLSKAKWWGLPIERRIGPKPRVGWVGISHHDLEILYPVIRALSDEVDWVCMGVYPKAQSALIKEKRRWVPYENYPNAMASLNLDLALAPLIINALNEHKNNVRLLEYGAMAWPVICSDILPYQENQAPVARVANTPDAWIEAIRTKVHDLDTAFREGEALRAWVKEHYLLEDHLDQWTKAYRC